MTVYDLHSDSRERARNIIQRLAHDCTERRQKSYLTSSIYNTAWISMVSKHVDGDCRWLFPECFDYILDSQLSHGGWHTFSPELAGTAAGDDGIINTMAALLALQTHQTSSQVVGSSIPHDLDKRISIATSALRSMLQVWDVDSCDNVGFELTVAAHLEMLEKHGVNFDFAGRQTLMDKRQREVSRFEPEHLYGQTVTSLLYSLEALIGKVDFDRVAHHKTHGSMMSSPTSTAAYLMNTSVWDEESEQYLRSALSSGTVPYAWPTTIFEINWVVKTFLAGGLTPEFLEPSQLNAIADYIENTLREQDGIIGWAPGLIREADDTSSAIYILSMLDRPTCPDGLLAAFESKDRFRCFNLDGNSSPSVNSHVLKALLQTPSPELYQSQILKAASYICDCWWNGNMDDKLSMTELYRIMLMSQALISMLASWDNGQLPDIPESFLKDRMLITLFGIFVTTLKAQNPDGSWGIRPSRETTAYALLVLANTASLPLTSRLGSQLRIATNGGRDFLLQHRGSWSEPDFPWDGTTRSESGLLAETYTIAALTIVIPSHNMGPSVERLCELEDQHRDIIFPRFTRLSMFSDTPSWLVEAAIIEGYLYKPMIRRASMDIFPRRDILSAKHMDIVPFCWTVSSHIKSAGMSQTMRFQMMIPCLLVYEIDHLMEKYIARLVPTETDGLKVLIDSLFEEHHSKICTSKDEIFEISHALTCFINWYLQHPSVLGSSVFVQRLLKKELRAFLLAQVTSVQESSRLTRPDSQSASAQIFSATETFYDWVHGTSAQHAGVQHLFSFLTCLLSAQQPGSQNCFPDVEANYLAQDLSAHLGTMARIENDYGSIERDMKERNLNSVNFPEFSSINADGNSALDLKAAKENLKQLATFERNYCEMVMRRLEPLVNCKAWRALQTFCNGIDLIGQLYAVDDFAPTIEK